MSEDPRPLTEGETMVVYTVIGLALIAWLAAFGWVTWLVWTEIFN